MASNTIRYFTDLNQAWDAWRFGTNIAGISQPIAYAPALTERERQEYDNSLRVQQRWNWELQDRHNQRTVKSAQYVGLNQKMQLIQSQYYESLAATNRIFSAQLEKFALQRDVDKTEQEIQRRNSVRQQGQVQASFGARGISLNGNLMMSLQQEQNLLDRVAKTRASMIDNEEKVTMESQEKSRIDLRQGYDSERLNIQTQLNVLQAQGVWS